MARSRGSLASLMAAVAIIAADLAALNATLPMIPNPGLVVLVVVLEVGLFRVARRRGPERAFWVGFEVAGWAWVVPNAVWQLAVWRLFRPLYEANVLGGPITGPGQVWRVVAVAGALHLALGLGVALAGGRIARAVAAHRIIKGSPCQETSPYPSS